MHRLERIDTLMLDLESQRAPMHTLKVGVVKPPLTAGFEEVRDSIASRVTLVPPFGWRLENPPGGLGRPAWVEDEHATSTSI